MRITAKFGALTVKNSTDRFKSSIELLLVKNCIPHVAVEDSRHCRGHAFLIRVAVGVDPRKNFFLVGDKPHEVFVARHCVHFSSQFREPKTMYDVFGFQIDTDCLGDWKNKFVRGYNAKLGILENPKVSFSGDIDGNGAFDLLPIQIQLL